VSVRQVLRQPTVWLLALGIMAANTGGYALVFWLPTTLKGNLAATGQSATDADVLNWLAPMYACGLAGVWLSGWSSDRTGERKWHCAAGMILTAASLALSLVPGMPWPVVFAGLCVTGFWAYFWPSPFWVLPTLTLTSSAAAVAVGVINMCANVAGLFGNAVVGEMREAGASDAACLLFLAGCYALGGAFVSLIRVRRPPA
jgi:ACS family tartrate transporter-like MFS transporter